MLFMRDKTKGNNLGTSKLFWTITSSTLLIAGSLRHKYSYHLAIGYSSGVFGLHLC